jgi:hypothetical protein
VTLGPIVTYLASKGYAEWRKKGLMIEGWPVQFLPVSDPLDQEALDCAVAVEERFGADGVVKTRVLSAEHLVAIALRTGKPKDFLRICTFLDDQVVDLDRLVQVIATHGLIDAWAAFCRKSGLTDPLAGKSRA